MTATPSAEMEVKLLPCPFCGVAMGVREHSAFHPTTADCWLGQQEHGMGLELDELDYPSWNRRPSSSIRREALEMAAFALQEAAWATAEEAFVAVECAEIVRALANDGKAEGET